MALNRIALNKVSLKRMTVPGTGGGAAPGPTAPTSYTVSQVFLASQTWTPPSGVTSVDWLVVGGGGGGGSQVGGGGGAGGFQTGTGLSVTPGTTYTLAVGAGGNASGGYNPGGGVPSPGSNGSNSGIFNTSSGTQLIGWSLGGGLGGSLGPGPGAVINGMTVVLLLVLVVLELSSYDIQQCLVMYLIQVHPMYQLLLQDLFIIRLLDQVLNPNHQYHQYQNHHHFDN